MSTNVYQYYFIWSKEGQGQLTLSIRSDEIFISRFIGHGFVCHCLEILCSKWHFRDRYIGAMFSSRSLPSVEVKDGSLALDSPSEWSRQQAAVIQLCLVPRLYTVHCTQYAVQADNTLIERCEDNWTSQLEDGLEEHLLCIDSCLIIWCSSIEPNPLIFPTGTLPCLRPQASQKTEQTLI